MSNILQVLGMPELPPRPSPIKPATKIVYRTIQVPVSKPISRRLAKQIKLLEAQQSLGRRKMTKISKQRMSKIFGKGIWFFVISFFSLAIISVAMY